MQQTPERELRMWAVEKAMESVDRLPNPTAESIVDKADKLEQYVLNGKSPND